jgi:glycosyltransferase involved in cell wall biosynthesis
MYTFDVEAGGGGLSLFALELGKKLDPDRFEVIFCSLGYYDTPLGNQRIERLNNNGYYAFEAAKWDEEKPYESFLEATKNLRKYFTKNPVDILHSHSEYTDVTALLLKIQRAVPKIIRTVHYSYRYEWNRKPLRRALLTNFSYPLLFDTEVGINKTINNRLTNRVVARMIRRRSQRIPNAISLERFKDIKIDPAEKKSSLGIPPEAPIVGTVGRLADQKGYQYLIGAIPEVLKQAPNTIFLFIGEGPMADELKELAQELDINSNVIFTGARNDVEELLQCMDIFASSSLWEGVPTVMLEAMASGVPIIATDIPGTNELIQHGKNGWLVPAYNSSALSEALLEFIKDPSRGKEFVRNGKETVTEYSISQIAKQYETLYEKLRT